MTLSKTPEGPAVDGEAARPAAPRALTREVERPGGDRGRATGLALVCSTAGVALGFALAGSMFAAMTPAVPVVHGQAGWSACPRGSRMAVEASLVRARDGQHGPTPWLGVVLNTAHGAPPVLLEVFADTPAARAGLRPGDVVIRFDGETPRSGAELRRIVLSREPGDVVDLDARGRDGMVRSLRGIRLEPMPLSR